MKRKKLLFGFVLGTVISLSGCEPQSDRVSYNLSQQADNFNVVREITVINCITGDVLFQMSGRMSIQPDTTDNQLEVLVENDGTYFKHFIGLSDNVSYVVEQKSVSNVNNYKYTLNFNPKMWVPVDVNTID